jgi:hypothetical protein
MVDRTAHRTSLRDTAGGARRRCQLDCSWIGVRAVEPGKFLVFGLETKRRCRESNLGEIEGPRTRTGAFPSGHAADRTNPLF